MNILQLSNFKAKIGKRHQPKKLLKGTANKFMLEKTALEGSIEQFIESYKNHKGKDTNTFGVEFAEENGQLYVKFIKPHDNALMFREVGSRYEAYNKALVDYMRKTYAKDEQGLFKFFITDTPNADGWYPTITTYKD